MEYTMYLEYCLANAKTSRLQCNEVLQKFAASPNANRFAKTILAILTEQSKILVDGADFKNLTKTLTVQIRGFYVREINHEIIFLVKLPNGLKPEIIAYNDDHLSLKLALSLVLFLSASPDLLIAVRRLSNYSPHICGL